MLKKAIESYWPVIETNTVWFSQSDVKCINHDKLKILKLKELFLIAQFVVSMALSKIDW